MNPIPFNRHILVSKQESKEKDGLVLVPDEYKQVNPFTLATVVESASDCKSAWTPGTTLVVPTHAIETLSFDGKEFCLVSENHILMGLFDK